VADLRQATAALRYREGMKAPVLVAKGRGLVAEEILRRAKEAGVYVHESPELVALLMQIDLDERIPPALYRAVAEILVWVYQLDRGHAAAPPLR
jgi:flagellar biosynthesis protein